MPLLNRCQDRDTNVMFGKKNNCNLFIREVLRSSYKLELELPD